MRNFKTILTATTLLFGTIGAMAIEKDTDGNYLLGSNADWTEFCALVNDGTEPAANAMLTADITVSGTVSSTTVGTSSNKYAGTFDGQGHTLTFNKTGVTGVDNVAPFKFINGATIKNLQTAGTLESNHTLMSGIVSEAAGASAITNCTSSMTLTCTAAGDATTAGILARGDNGASTTITNCAYTGVLTAESGVSGIVGYFRNGSSATFTVSNVLFTGTITCSGTSNIRNIYRAAGSGTTSNMYYVAKANGTATDGTQATESQLLNGELAKTLADADATGNILFWGQGNLNRSTVDAYPNLTTDAKKAVKQVAIQYMSTKPLVNPQGAAPNPCRFGKLGFKADSGDATTLQTMPADWDYSSDQLLTTTGMYCIQLAAAASTLVLPFDCDVLPDGIKAYEVSYTAGDDHLTATPVDKITKDQPVVINGTAGQTYKFTGTFSSYSATSVTNGVMTGVYVDAGSGSGYNPIATVPADSYVLQAGASGIGFYRVSAEKPVRITSFRAYLTIPSSARQLGIVYGDGTTGISKMRSEEGEMRNVYNLNGQRVSQPAHGLYIMNGRKILFP